MTSEKKQKTEPMEGNITMGKEMLVSLNDVREKKTLVAKNSGELKLAASGLENSSSFRIHGTDGDGSKKISLWHDVSLVHQDRTSKTPTEYYNFVCEIPKFTRWVAIG